MAGRLPQTHNLDPALAPKLTFVLLEGVVEAQRRVKDAGEVRRIEEAIHVAERGFRMFVATLREADTEKDMVDALEGYVRRAGGRGTSFPPIVAVGQRGALPHAPRPRASSATGASSWSIGARTSSTSRT